MAMHDRYRAPRSYSQQEAFIHASGLTAASPPPRVLLGRAKSRPVEMMGWQAEVPASGLGTLEVSQKFDVIVRETQLPAAGVEEVFRLVSELPYLSPPKSAPEQVVDVEDLLTTIEGGAVLGRPPELHELATKVATRAEAEAANPPTRDEIEEWACRLADEASELTD